MEGISAILTGSPITATGGILSAPLSTTRPTDAVTALPAGFVKKGYVGQDGVTKKVDKTDEKIKAWGGDVVKIVQTEHSVTLQCTMIEAARAEVNREVYGEPNVTATAATTTAGNLLAVRLTADQLPHMSRIVEIKDGDARMRLVAPDSQITEVGDVTFQDASIISYPVTVECFPDESGVKLYIYSDDGKKAATP